MAQKKVLVLNTSGTQINPAQDESVVLLRKIVKLLESNAVVDSSQRQRIIAEQATAANLLCTATIASGTITSVSSATLAATSANIGQVVIGYGAQASAAANIIDSRYTLIDQARNAYANGIRSKLVWS